MILVVLIFVCSSVVTAILLQTSPACLPGLWAEVVPKSYGKTLLVAHGALTGLALGTSLTTLGILIMKGTA